MGLVTSATTELIDRLDLEVDPLRKNNNDPYEQSTFNNNQVDPMPKQQVDDCLCWLRLGWLNQVHVCLKSSLRLCFYHDFSSADLI